MTLIFDSYEEEQAFKAGEAREREKQSSSCRSTSSPQGQPEDKQLDAAIDSAASSISLAKGRDQFSLQTLLPPELAKAVDRVMEAMPADFLTSP